MVVSRLDALDTVLSSASIDGARARQIAVEISEGCTACHAVYRDQTPSGGYRLKPNVLQ